MSDETEDLWPARFPNTFEDPEPVKILKDQARLLARKTGGAVEGVVVESTIEATAFYSLYLKAPALGDYMFKVLSIAVRLEDVLVKPFPKTTVLNSFTSEERHIGSADEFKKWLRSVLGSEQVQGVVGGMIQRSTQRVSS